MQIKYIYTVSILKPQYFEYWKNIKNKLHRLQ